jgi:hypothetical protein
MPLDYSSQISVNIMGLCLCIYLAVSVAVPFHLSIQEQSNQSVLSKNVSYIDVRPNTPCSLAWLVADTYNTFGGGSLWYWTDCGTVQTVLLGAVCSRVSFETSFDSKQPKLEPKLVSALSETKRLFRLFRFYTETESFDVSIEPKKQKANRNSLIGSIFFAQICEFKTREKV